MNAQEFLSNTLGKWYDIDGYYGAQCWDYFAKLCQDLGYKIINCTNTGYVKDIWYERKTNGVLTNFKEVAIEDLQIGDVVVFGNAQYTPDSHIGIFKGWNEKNSNMYLQAQNQGDTQNVNVITMPCVGIIGCLRPKAWDIIKFPIAQSGSVVALFDYIRVREEPSLSKGNTGYVYNSGMRLNYDSIIQSEGWYWLSYISANTGTRRYIAYATTDLKTIYWK